MFADEHKRATDWILSRVNSVESSTPALKKFLRGEKNLLNKRL